MPSTTRERWPTGDGDALSVERIRGRSNAPRLVIFHGLEGGMQSAYARSLLHHAAERGWWADLVLWRTCDGQPVNAVPRSYHSGATDDADLALSHVMAEDPGRPLLLIGISIGGNVMLKWLGERGTAVPASVRGAFAISVPYDLAAASRRIEMGFSKMYSRFFLRSLKAKALAKLARFPDYADERAIRTAATMRAFDDAVTAPVHGFRDAADYYARASSLPWLDRVRVPALLVNARNDPFLPSSVLDEVTIATRGNPMLRCLFPDQGGHVGFIGGPPWRPTYWLEDLALDWLESHLPADYRALQRHNGDRIAPNE